MSSSEMTSVLEDWSALKGENNALKSENADLQRQLQQLQHDYQNARRRSESNLTLNKALRQQTHDMELKLVAKQKTIDQLQELSQRQAIQLARLQQNQYVVRP